MPLEAEYCISEFNGQRYQKYDSGFVMISTHYSHCAFHFNKAAFLFRFLFLSCVKPCVVIVLLFFSLNYCVCVCVCVVCAFLCLTQCCHPFIVSLEVSFLLYLHGY